MPPSLITTLPDADTSLYNHDKRVINSAFSEPTTYHAKDPDSRSAVSPHFYGINTWEAVLGAGRSGETRHSKLAFSVGFVRVLQ